MRGGDNPARQSFRRMTEGLSMSMTTQSHSSMSVDSWPAVSHRYLIASQCLGMGIGGWRSYVCKAAPCPGYGSLGRLHVLGMVLESTIEGEGETSGEGLCRICFSVVRSQHQNQNLT